MAATVATGANAQRLLPERRGTPKSTAPGDPLHSMEDIADGASRVPNYIENIGTDDRYGR
jgi:hypothetical protein